MSYVTEPAKEAITGLTAHDIDDILHSVNTILLQMDGRFRPVEEQFKQTIHNLAFISNQLASILRRLDAIEATQASLVRRLQEHASMAASRRPYRERVRQLATGESE